MKEIVKLSHTAELHDKEVDLFAVEEHAEIFCKEFGGERMHPSEKGRRTHWSRWNKGAYKPKADT